MRRRPFALFMSPGLRSRHLGVRGGALFAIAVAALAATPVVSSAQPNPHAASRMLTTMDVFRAHPVEVFLKIAQGTASGSSIAKARSAAGDLGRVLSDDVMAGGDERRDAVARLLESGVRGAFARGLSMADALDVLTAIDPMGELLPEETRGALWRELARRPQSARPLPGARGFVAPPAQRRSGDLTV